MTSRTLVLPIEGTSALASGNMSSRKWGEGAGGVFQGSECFAPYSAQRVHETFFSKTVSVQSTAENAEDTIEDEQKNYAIFPLSLYFSASSAPSAVNYYQ